MKGDTEMEYILITMMAIVGAAIVINWYAGS